MDTYLNFKAFQAAAQFGSFSRAARELDLAASVVTKRVNQLEHQLQATLFERSTRHLALTEAGRRYLDRCRPLMADFDDLLRGPSRAPDDVEDFLRVKAPTSLTVLHLRNVFDAYQAEFQKVRLEIVLLDRSVDPVLEGFDVSIGAHWSLSFTGVIEKPLCPLRRMLCASPDYVARHGMPKHPRDLVAHQCLSFLPTGNIWTFEDRHGPIAIEVKPRLTSNDGQMLVSAAVNAGGIAIVSNYLVKDLVQSGRLVRVLPDFPVPDLWIKAVSPERRAASPAVSALMSKLEAFLSPVPPWER
jgi:DNA-binding transcriptional LysR family regulator